MKPSAARRNFSIAAMCVKPRLRRAEDGFHGGVKRRVIFLGIVASDGHEEGAVFGKAKFGAARFFFLRGGGGMESFQIDPGVDQDKLARRKMKLFAGELPFVRRTAGRHADPAEHGLGGIEHEGRQRAFPPEPVIGIGGVDDGGETGPEGTKQPGQRPGLGAVGVDELRLVALHQVENFAGSLNIFTTGRVPDLQVNRLAAPRANGFNHDRQRLAAAPARIGEIERDFRMPPVEMRRQRAHIIENAVYSRFQNEQDARQAAHARTSS
jgi:hypothetical protein